MSVLRLEKMGISGFKSFGDRTEIQFPPGVTAIVGPNGCGKSNIGDAINWVLGEQSAKMLRGQQMADVIFSGSEARKALGMAEVSLSFGGAMGLPQDDHGKVVITRRLFRSGESEYQINGARARLKDIQEMLRQARVGARTYATIEQGKIDQVLNAKPRERRALIEDAAGIAGYKHKRRLAELKLEATRANLLRVNDIVVEVKRQINSLKRQAARARRYRKLREELRAKEMLRFGAKARELEEELKRLRLEQSGAHDAQSEAAARLGRLEADLLERRDVLDKLDRSCREAAENVHRLDLVIDREEAQVRACREKIDEASGLARQRLDEAERLSGRHRERDEASRLHGASVAGAKEELEQLTQSLATERTVLEEEEAAQRELRQSIEQLRERQFAVLAQAADQRNRLRNAEESLERGAAQRSRIESEQAETDRALTENRGEAERLSEQLEEHRQRTERKQAELGELESRLETARKDQETQSDALAHSREEEKSAQARLATLEDLETRFAGVSDGAKRLLSAGAEAGIRTHGVVADHIQATQEVENAAEGYLQWLLPAVVLDGAEDATRAAAFLRSQGAGRTALICAGQPAGRPAVGSANGDVPRHVLEDRRVLGRLRDGLTLRSSANGSISERIGDAVLVDSLDSALALHRDYPQADYLTPDGEIVYASGVISVGCKPTGDQGLLAHKRRLTGARSAAERAASRVGDLRDRVGDARAEAARVEEQLGVRRAELELATRQGVELQHRGERSDDESRRDARRSEVLTDEIEGLLVEFEQLGRAREVLREETGRVEDERARLEAELLEGVGALERNDETLKQRLDRVSELRAEAAAGSQRVETIEQEDRRLAEAAAELRSRLDGLRGEAAEATERARASETLLLETETALVQNLEQRKKLSSEAAKMEREIGERRESLTRDGSQLGSLRAELDKLREKTREAELERARAEAAREHLDDLCRQELGLPTGQVEQEAQTADTPIDLEALESEVEEIKRKIDRLGPVNMTAIEEFSELEERDAFLTSQRDDLTRSMESLKETIRRINRESRQRFLDAFEQIRVGYQEVFKLLFKGGRADLRLEEGEDVLECGIDILAQPPGKRLTGVHLLSGGEKALSAIALLFAVFRYQPSPFCLLDEVDAALDDANVSRFTRMISEYAKNTQFVVITHNKLSMEAADLLYGVTMEEPGVSKLISLQLT